MCGINAVFDRNGNVVDRAARVRSMNGQMVYRGPDDEGNFAAESVALGMRRLSIIDVAGGHQPLFNEDRSLVLVCNGEIYNFVELRQELEAKGHRFSSKSDCETILHLYEELDTGCLDRLRGMFAFVLWDQRQRRLFAARDRVGIKPLYYAEQNGALWLSSELKAILAGAGLSPTLDPVAVWQFLHYSHPIDLRRTVVREVTRVLPGEFLLADQDGTRHHRYWNLRYGQVPGPAPSDDELLDTLRDAVRIHLRSDVPVGLLLSGGLDSSAIGALAAKAGGNYTGICVGYADPYDFDERPAARQTAREHGLGFQEVVLDPDGFARWFNDLTACCDEPIADPSAAPEWAIYQAARSLGFKVMLCGIGGDELFFGYRNWNRLGAAWAREGQAAGSFSDGSAFYSHDQWLLSQVARPDFRAAAAASDQVLDAYTQTMAYGPDRTYSILFNVYLGLNCLTLSDKLSMGRSLELRVPLADHVLIEAVMRVPLQRRFSPTETKPLFRRMLKDVLSPETLHRPKSAFRAPTDYLRALVRNGRDEIAGGELACRFLNRQYLSALLPRGQRDALLENRLSRAVKRRLFIPLRAVGANPLALSLAGGRSTWFLYCVLVFERWWQQIRDLAPTPRR
jgi:asparagine synthase (glutamine-hydrolysing)